MQQIGVTVPLSVTVVHMQLELIYKNVVVKKVSFSSDYCQPNVPFTQ